MTDLLKNISNNTEVAEIEEFVPTDGQRTLKSRFWHEVRLSAKLTAEVIEGDVTASFIQRVTRNGSIRTWWGRPGFKEWFLDDADEVEIEANVIASLALREIKNILNAPLSDKNASAKIKAVQLAMELKGKLGKGNNKELEAGMALRQNLLGCSDEELQRLSKVAKDVK